jgi:hypothetical protein
VAASKSGWPVVYYRTAEGTEPVDAFIDALQPKVQVVLDNQIERLAIFGPHLPFPHSSQVAGELRELRATTATLCTGSCTGDRATCSCCSTSSRSAPGRSRTPTSRWRTNGGPTSSGAWTRCRVAHRELPVMTPVRLTDFSKVIR